MYKLYCIEGADGTGKSTLAEAISKKYGKANILHCSYNKEWNLETYHEDMLEAANILREYQPVILDRWSPSAHAYQTVFDGEAPYDVIEFMNDLEDELENTVYIYCRNSNAIKTHAYRLGKGEEMFDDISKVIEEYEKFITKEKKEGKREWLIYDFGNVNMQKFVEMV